MKKKLSEHFTGRKNPNYPKHKSNTIFSEWSKQCPGCGKIIYCSGKYNLDVALKKNTLCNSCSTYKYKKNWVNVIGEKEIKQMRATKAGFQDWEEYEKLYPEKKQYQSEVRRLTFKQPLHLLKDYALWESNKGLCGTDGAYQIDHIISIDEGYSNGIDPMVIANIKNLQILPWKENRNKGK